jgi:hypothetical protein
MEEAAEKGIDPDEISLEICIQCETFNRGTVDPMAQNFSAGFPKRAFSKRFNTPYYEHPQRKNR